MNESIRDKKRKEHEKLLEAKKILQNIAKQEDEELKK